MVCIPKRALVMVAPVIPNRGTRSVDAFGGGGFGAPRSKSCNCPKEERPECPVCDGTGRISYKHKGLDFIARPKDTIVRPFPCAITRTGIAYIGSTLGSIHLQGVDDFAMFRAKILYAAVLDGLVQGPEIAGTWLAKAQDIATYHNAEGRMTNHIHFALWRDEELIDPAPYFRG